MRKTVLSFLLAAGMTFAAAAWLPESKSDDFSMTAYAAQVNEGQCGEAAVWTLDDSGTLTISGTGDMTDYDYWKNFSPFTKLSGSVKKVVVGDGITRVGAYSFYNCTALKEVQLPESLTSVGSHAFRGCTSMQSVTLPKGVTAVDEQLFYGCTRLSSVTLGSVKSIGREAFARCSALKNLTVPSSVETIDSAAFEKTPWLDILKKTSPMVCVNGILIDGSGASGEIKIPSGVTRIAQDAFRDNTNIKKVTISSSVKSIMRGAFSGCSNLKYIDIPRSVTLIEKGAIGYASDHWEDEKIEGLTIYCSNASAGEIYAAKNWISYIVKDRPVTRYPGNTRYDTASLISRGTFSSADTVFLASGTIHADALAGVPLATAYKAPILLSSRDTLSSGTLAEIKRLKAKQVIILGGKSAVSEKVEKILTKNGLSFRRIAGVSRFDTAARIADELMKKTGTAPSEIFFIYYNSFADALSASTAAAVKGAPVLYVYKQGALNCYIRNYLNKVKGSVKNGYIIGGSDIITDSMMTTVKNTLGGKTVERLSGSTRYNTCIEVNKKFAGDLNGSSICIATGEIFPDALAGGVAAAIRRAPLFLVNGKALTAQQQAYLKTRPTQSLYVFGSAGSVSDSLIKEANVCFTSANAEAIRGYLQDPIPDEVVLAAANSGKHKLMIIAHSDDDSLWGGGHLMDADYFILCISTGAYADRNAEFKRVLALSGNSGHIMDYTDLVFGVKDSWETIWDNIKDDIERIMTCKNWDLIVTHNMIGEYGNIQHTATHNMVTEIYDRYAMPGELYFFGTYYSKKLLDEMAPKLVRLTDEEYEFKKKLLACYVNQRKSVRNLWGMTPYEMWTLYERYSENPQYNKA